MAEFYVRYHYQSKEGGLWTGTSSYVKTNDETPSASALIALLKEKSRCYDIKIEEVERRGEKNVEFYVNFHYKTNPTSFSRSSTSTYVKWYDEDPSMSDIQALVTGKRYRDYDISIDKVQKR